MEVQSPLVDNTNAVKSGVGSYPSLPTQGTTPAGNTLGKSSYANVFGEPSRKALNFRTLFTPGETGLMLLCRQSRSELLAKGGMSQEFEWVVAKNLKSQVQTSRVSRLLPKVGFKPTKEYRHVPKKLTANSSGNKEESVDPTNEVPHIAYQNRDIVGMPTKIVSVVTMV
ncbi:hypothetical protein Tco_1313479 [Tanacetum coccineum]